VLYFIWQCDSSHAGNAGVADERCLEAVLRRELRNRGRVSRIVGRFRQDGDEGSSLPLLHDHGTWVGP
jgi:hypothetical protein